jgi:hypothetical protein
VCAFQSSRSTPDDAAVADGRRASVLAISFTSERWHRETSVHAEEQSNVMLTATNVACEAVDPVA